MKKSLLQRWCDYTWLYLVYFLGVCMVCVLIWNWNDWETPQKLVCMLAVAVPMHIFEENSFPAGFYYMNNVGFHSKEPMVYPQNECTNMVTNLGAEIVLILVTFSAPRIPVSAVVLVVAFGLGETLNHTRAGILMYLRYRDRGKKTVYGPGTVTSWCILIPLSVAGVRWLTEHPFTGMQILGGIGIFAGIAVFLIGLPFVISIRVRSQRFAFTDKGYFEKYEKTPEA